MIMSYSFGVPQDIIENLIELDGELHQYHLKQPITIYVFGGSALLLHKNYRATEDIDAFYDFHEKQKQLTSLFQKYNVNNQLMGVMSAPPPEDFQTRAKKLNVSFENLIVYIAAKEDIIISKIFTTRSSKKDMDDITKSGILDDVDIEFLEKLYLEYKEYMPLPESRYYTLTEVLEKYKEWKKSK